MATTKITVTIPDDELAAIKKLVNSGQAASVSGFVQHAIAVSLQDITGWGAMLATALDETGGGLTPEERAWADEVLGTAVSKTVAEALGGVSPGITLDAGAMIALDRDDRRVVVVLLARAAETSAVVTIPASALAQAIRDTARQARLARLMRHPRSEVVPLDGNDAVGIGRLLSSSHSADVVDAHVVLCARRAGQAVATSDAADLGRLDPTLRLIEI